MAKDDYHVIVAKILIYLYKKYKRKYIELNYIAPLTKDFRVYDPLKSAVRTTKNV